MLITTVTDAYVDRCRRAFSVDAVNGEDEISICVISMCVSAAAAALELH